MKHDAGVQGAVKEPRSILKSTAEKNDGPMQAGEGNVLQRIKTSSGAPQSFSLIEAR